MDISPYTTLSLILKFTQNMKEDFTKDNPLFQKVAELIELSRRKVIATVNLTMVHTYFEIGRMIVEEQQQGKERAKYGQHILQDLSQKLTAKFGKGFSEQNLRNMRQFFLIYSTDNLSSIRQTASSELEDHEKPMNDTSATPIFTLSGSHYLILMRIERLEERSFYEIEAKVQNWSEAQLKRQYHSSLYERLALSRNKEEVMRLAKEGQVIEKSKDILKNPLGNMLVKKD